MSDGRRVVALVLARTDPGPVLVRALHEARARDAELLVVQPVVPDADLPAAGHSPGTTRRRTSSCASTATVTVQ